MQKTIVVAYREDKLNSKVLAWMEMQSGARIIAVHFGDPEMPILSNVATVIGADRVYMIEGNQKTIGDPVYKAHRLLQIAVKEKASEIAVDLELYPILQKTKDEKNNIKIVSPEAQL